MSAKVLSLQVSASPQGARKWKRVSHNLVLNQDTGYYYVRKKKAGRDPLFETTGTTKKGLAQNIADAKMAEWLGGKHIGGRRRKMGQLWDDLDAELEKMAHTTGEDGNLLRRKRTRDKDGTYGPIIKELFGDTYPDEWDEQRWATWVRTDGRRLGRKLGDIAKYLSMTLTFAYERKVIGRKPRIKNPDPPPAAPTVYEEKEIRVFLKYARPELQDLIVIGAECGLRPHENRELPWEWVKFEKGRAKVTLPVTFTKTKKAREIVLSAAASAILKRRHRSRNGPYVFPAPADPMRPMSDVRLSRWWRSMGRAMARDMVAKGKKPMEVRGTLRHMRHTFFSQALHVAKKPLPMVAAYGGNSPKILFDRYLAKDPERTREVSDAFNLGLEEE